MVPPRFGPGLYGCCGARKPPGEQNNYCPACRREYMRVWRSAHHLRGDPYYEKHLVRCRRVGKELTQERQADREWRGRRVRSTIAAMNDVGVGCQEIARRLGVSDMSVYDWRSGKRTPFARNADQLYRLAEDIAVQRQRESISRVQAGLGV